MPIRCCTAGQQIELIQIRAQASIAEGVIVRAVTEPTILAARQQGATAGAAPPEGAAAIAVSQHPGQHLGGALMSAGGETVAAAPGLSDALVFIGGAGAVTVLA